MKKKNITLNLCSGSIKNSLEKIFRLFSMPMFSVPDIKYLKLETIRIFNNVVHFSVSEPGVNNIPFGAILINSGDPLSSDVLEYCQRMRLKGGLNPVYDLNWQANQLSRQLVIHSWNGSVENMIRFCLKPTFISLRQLSKECHSYIENQLRHNVPKLIPACPFLQEDDMVAFIRDRLKDRELPRIQFEAYLQYYDNAQSGVREFIRMVWGVRK